ncbi:CU044_5270 family protein [Isoptericola sp. NPDC019693]|uniref:CU044_5270 family protein n=1 Tax=Isoptericola sp. NPDC019693 TaxID=3364009 RepID=UPI00379A5D89
MNLLTDPTLRRLSAANPAAAAPLTASEETRAEETLGQIMTAAPRPARAVRARRRWWPRVAAAGTAVAAIVAAGVLGTAPASAELVLLEAADGAATQPVGDGEYWYVHEQVTESGMGPYELGPYDREVWRSRDTLLIKDEISAALAAAEHGDSTLDPSLVRVLDLSDTVEGGGPPVFGGNPQFTWDELDELPTEPAALTEQLTAGMPASDHGYEWDLWSQAVSLLQGSPAGPELRRALWQILAGIPDVELIGHTPDSTGRDATAVRADFSDRGLGIAELLLDPVSGALLETRLMDNDGTVMLGTTVLEQGPRDSAPAPEPPLCGPGSVPETSC